jgi:nucleoside-diphosphate-sugar epimerase
VTDDRARARRRGATTRKRRGGHTDKFTSRSPLTESTIDREMPSILLVGPSSRGSLMAVLAEALRGGGNVVATTHMPTSQDAAFALCRGVNAVVILPETQDIGERTWLDTAGRGTYDLLSAACDSTSTRSVIVLSTMDLFLGYPSTFKVGADWQPRPSTDPTQLSPHVTEFVAREFARGSALSVVIARVGHLDDNSERFWVKSSDASEQLVSLIVRRGASDPVDTHHHPGKYRVLHLIDSSCEVLPAGEDVDVAAARAATGAVSETVAPDNINKVLLLGANGMLGPPVVNELGDSYALSVTDVNPYGWRKGGDNVVAGTGERDDIDLVKPLSDFAQPCESAILDVADADGVAEATAVVDVRHGRLFGCLSCLMLV